jgi:hypothetical protein
MVLGLKGRGGNGENKSTERRKGGENEKKRKDRK